MFLVDLRELAADATAGDRVGGRADTSASSGPRDRPRVLVVEDSVGVRELERVDPRGRRLRGRSPPSTASTAPHGCADAPADLVVSDVEMPGMDGFALTRTIRRTRGWEQVPVIIMTSRGDEDDQRAGLEAGASAYLLKTEFDQNQLVETVRRLVGR